MKRLLVVLLGFLTTADAFRQLDAAITWFDAFGVPWALLDVAAGLYVLWVGVHLPSKKISKPVVTIRKNGDYEKWEYRR